MSTKLLSLKDAILLIVVFCSMSFYVGLMIGIGTIRTTLTEKKLGRYEANPTNGIVKFVYGDWSKEK